jgi:hypothetical protein
MVSTHYLFYPFLPFLSIMQTIDGIFDTIQSFNYSQFGNSYTLGSLAHSFLQFLSNTRPWYKSNNVIPTYIRSLGTDLWSSHFNLPCWVFFLMVVFIPIISYFTDTPVGLASNAFAKNFI